MRIAIDARYVADHFPGIGRYVYNLLAALAELDQPHTLVVLHNPALRNTRHDLAALARAPRVELLATAARPFALSEQVAIPRLLRRARADLYHAPYYAHAYAGRPCPAVVTLYDAIPRRFPHEVSPRARLLFDALTRLAARSARHVLAISQSARADLIADYGIAPERISVTPLAADPRFRPQPPQAVADARARYGLPERYVLSVSSNKPHKNLVRLVEAWAQVTEMRRHADAPTEGAPSAAGAPGLPASQPPGLVIAGHWDARYPESQRRAEALGLAGRVRFLPGVAEADLPALYSGAEAFAFVSRYEGFGLPPLEAMACGAAVLCGASSSLPEVVGEAALLADPERAESIAAGLARLLGDPALRGERRAASLRRAAGFSWRRTAELTLAVYERAAAAGRLKS